MRPLSRQQTRIIIWFDSPLSHHQIAATLHMNRSTYKQHVDRLYRNLEVHGRIQAIKAWEQAGRQP